MRAHERNGDEDLAEEEVLIHEVVRVVPVEPLHDLPHARDRSLRLADLQRAYAVRRIVQQVLQGEDAIFTKELLCNLQILFGHMHCLILFILDIRVYLDQIRVEIQYARVIVGEHLAYLYLSLKCSLLGLSKFFLLNKHISLVQESLGIQVVRFVSDY